MPRSTGEWVRERIVPTVDMKVRHDVSAWVHGLFLSTSQYLKTLDCILPERFFCSEVFDNVSFCPAIDVCEFQWALYIDKVLVPGPVL